MAAYCPVPLISAGAYGWPFADAVRTAAQTIRAHGAGLDVRLVIFGAAAHERAVRLVDAGP